VSDAARAAEEIKRKAREEAAAILANAQTQTGGVVPVAGAVGSTGAMGKFITGEREFLQSLASLIQQHAESVKSTARDAQHSQAAAAKAAAAALPTVPVSAPELSEQSAIEDTSPELSAARSEDAAGDSSVTHAAEEATESAWTATASPAAPPATNESPYAEQAVNSSEFSSGTAGRDEVISIPPSAVDTPMADLSAESASTQEAGQSDFGTRVSVDLEQREFDDEGEVASVRLPDSPLSESDEPATETPGEERSLRDLFWGDDK
jgi:hypothetical protein